MKAAPINPADRDPSTAEAAAARRVIEAAEEFHAAAHAYGLDWAFIGSLHTPFTIRADAWLYRVRVERAAWRRVMRSPLFVPRETLWPVAS